MQQRVLAIVKGMFIGSYTLVLDLLFACTLFNIML